MPTTSLQELLVQYTSAEIAQQILDTLAAQDPPLPVTSWESGSVPQTMVSTFADSEANLYTAQYNVAQGGYLGLATGDWLTLLAFQNYGTERAGAVNTQGLVQLTDAGGGPHTITANVTTVASGSKRFVATSAATLPLNSKIFIPVQAVIAGNAGNVSNNTITTLITALAGVSVSNPIPWISRIGTASVATQGYVKITNSAGGTTGAGTIIVSDSSGLQYTNVSAVTLVATVQTSVLFEASAVGTNYNVGNGSITTVVSDGALTGTTTATNTAPSSGSWITRSGSDEQSDSSLRTESQNLLLARGIDWVAAGIEYLATNAPITSGSVISRVRVVSNPGGVAGKIAVYVATSAGAPTVGDVADVQSYLDDNRSLTSTVEVLPAVVLPITITATASVPSAYLATAQSNASTNLAALEADTPIGGDPNAGNAIQLEDIIAAIKSASYNSLGQNTNPASPTVINVTAPAADVALAADEIPDFTVNITWTGI